MCGDSINCNSTSFAAIRTIAALHHFAVIRLIAAVHHLWRFDQLRGTSFAAI
jgi:hypothetical protein